MPRSRPQFTLEFSSPQAIAKTVILSTTLQSALLTNVCVGLLQLPWCHFLFSPSLWVPDSGLLWEKQHFWGATLVSARLGSHPIYTEHLSNLCLSFAKYLGLCRLEAFIIDEISGRQPVLMMTFSECPRTLPSPECQQLCQQKGQQTL